MADFSALIAQIEAYVKQNGNNEITGNGLQSILVGMVNALGTVAITALQGDLADEVAARTNADGAINAKIPAEASSSNKLADKAFVTGLTTPLQNAVNAINANIENGYVYAGIATPSGTPVSGKVFYLARQAGTYTNFGGLTLTEGVNVLKYNGTAWSQEQLISIADIYRNPLMGYYECDTAGGTAAKTVAATGYVLPATGGSVKIKMANRNTVANATLNINSTGAKPLYYNGQRAGVGNTWDTNEIVEVFYDGTNYQAYNVAGSNGDGVFDISAYNLTDGQPTPYVDLSAALGTDGANVPQSLRKGGMSVKFIQGTVQSSDNKYVQYRLTENSFTIDSTKWQGVDGEPTPNSINMAESGGIPVYASRKNFDTIPLQELPLFDYLISETNVFTYQGKHSIIPVKPNDKIWIKIYGGSSSIGVRFALVKSYVSPKSGDALDLCDDETSHSLTNNGDFYCVAPSDAKYLVINRVYIDDDRTSLYTHIMINDINIVDTGINNIRAKLGVKRYKGTTGTYYYWREQVDIKSGSVVHNCGTGTVRLYDVYDGSNYITLKGGDVKVLTFDVTQIKGYSSTDLPYDLAVYTDRDVIVDANGIMLKDGVTAIIKNVAGDLQTATISSDFTFAKLPFTILKGSVIKSLTSTGGRTSVAGRTTDDTSETALTLTAGTVVTKDINYIRWYADTFNISVVGLSDIYDYSKDVYNSLNKEIELIYSEKTFEQDFTSQYQQLPAVFPMRKGMVVKSILLNGTESKLYGRTEDNYTETALIISAGTVLTKDINYLRNIYSASAENPAEYTVILFNPYTYTDYKVADEIKKVAHSVEGSADTAKDDSMTNGDELALNNYPQSLRKGDNIVFTAKITSFSGLKIGHGCETKYLNSWFEIDDTNVKLYHYTSSTSGGGAILIGSEAHGLTITEMININIVYNGSITIKMQSSDGYYEHEFTADNDPDPATALKNYYNSTNGIIKAISVGSTLTDVSLSATNSDFKLPIWLFGASYTAIYANQMCGQLKKMGYFNYLSNGYPGCMSSAAFTALQKAIQFGTPQMIIWSIMSNDTDYSTWKSYASQVAQLCNERGIVLVFVNYPDMKQKEFSDRRQWVINSGHRYIDLPAAVEKTPYVYDTDFWYPGFMGSDGVHATPLGANAMAMQILRDLPEIMQY